MKRIAILLTALVMAIAAVVFTAVRLNLAPPKSESSSSTGFATGATENAAAVPLQMPGDAVRITQADFLPLHEDRRVLVIDVRGESSYRDGHIPGAINIGTEAVKDRVAEILVLAAGRPIVTYCSCVNEHTSAVAAVRLVEAGAADVRALVGGYPAWIAEGGPVAKGDGSGE